MDDDEAYLTLPPPLESSPLVLEPGAGRHPLSAANSNQSSPRRARRSSPPAAKGSTGARAFGSPGRGPGDDNNEGGGDATAKKTVLSKSRGPKLDSERLNEMECLSCGETALEWRDDMAADAVHWLDGSNSLPYRLLGPDGLPKLRTLAKKFRFKGKGHEVEDLNGLMTFYQTWAHGLYPRIQFSSFVERSERVCRQRRAKIYLGTVLRDSLNFAVDGGDANDDEPRDRAQGDDEDIARALEHEAGQDNHGDGDFDPLPFEPARMPFSGSATHLTPEQVALIQANKARALERLAERRRAMDEAEAEALAMAREVEAMDAAPPQGPAEPEDFDMNGGLDEATLAALDALDEDMADLEGPHPAPSSFANGPVVEGSNPALGSQPLCLGGEPENAPQSQLLDVLDEPGTALDSQLRGVVDESENAPESQLLGVVVESGKAPDSEMESELAPAAQLQDSKNGPTGAPESQPLASSEAAMFKSGSDDQLNPQHSLPLASGHKASQPPGSDPEVEQILAFIGSSSRSPSPSLE